nr:sensor histidine kinase [Anaerolinea sp.]
MTQPRVPTINSDLTPGLRRWILFWNTLTYSSLLIVSLLALFSVRMDWPRPTLPLPLTWPIRLACLAGSLLWGAWYWFFVVRFGSWVGREHWKALSFAFAILLSFALSWLHPAFMFLLFSFYGVTFGVLPVRFSVPLVALLPLLMAARIVSPAGLTLANFVNISWVIAYGLAAILLGLWLNALLRQGRERQVMLEKLQAAQEELARQEREAGMLAERQRLAGVIHDTLAQDLASIVIHLEAAEQSLVANLPDAQQHIDQARRTAREGLAEARRFVWALQPEVANREPLQHALQRIAHEWSREQSIPAEFTCDGTPCPLPPPAEVTLLRAAQEGLANVRKHAQATRVNLTLTYLPDEVLLDIQDDGRGFDPADLPERPGEEGGYGLFSLRERARELGGSLEMES